MEKITSIIPVLPVLIPLVGIILIVAFRKIPNIREAWTLTASVLMFLMVASMAPSIFKGSTIEYTLLRIIPGLELKFKLDAFGLCFALIASLLWIITSIYSIGYMRSLNEHSQTRYFVFFALALSSAMGVALSANLFTLYLFYETLSLATYPLVTHHQDSEARISGRKYLSYLLGTSVGFQLPAMILTYALAGTLEFSQGGILTGTASTALLVLIFVLFVLGFAKAAIMPFHSWLPSAMVAPTPVSALLHAVAVVKVGVFSILRVTLFVFGLNLMRSLNLGLFLAYFVSITIITGSLFALTQDNLKLRLAYSTISQLSYIVLGAALLTLQGITGGILHIAMHAFGKITLFFCAGSIMITLGKKNVSEMRGIGRKMPLTMLAFFIGALSVIGLPPCGGFISKWYLALGCIQAKQLPLLAVILVSSLLNAAYFLPIVYQGFFGKPNPHDEVNEKNSIQEGPPLVVTALVVTSMISIVLFFYPQPFLKLAYMVAHSLIGG